MSRRTYRVSTWSGIALLVVAIVGGGLYYFFGRTTQNVAIHSLPVPTSVSVRPLAPPTPHSPEPSAPTTSGATTHKNKVTPAVSIPPGVPKQVYVPAFEGAPALSARVFTMPSSCKSMIVPPDTGDIYSCTDFALPGTNSASKAVLTGHSSPFQATELNKLNAMAKRGNLVGHSVFVKTTASGARWLQYVITNVHHVVKAKLPYDQATWGVPGRSTAGRLVIVTCLPINVVPAHDNFVVVAQLKGVGTTLK
ncbi:MAG TPA: hypothetical protein VFQ70_00170 [Candidatus Saccharimonadaceae bacterium]|nr:hypothetical protein [Candidatus Saccharimonadaceae bacterium]